ncbi:metal ABC transporter permease [Pelagibaculum spongiae]|uniref:High-affinity zinc uptake system membrane protein ZnuB n=1 Tax=Pelagibaculum spongiae TaxID=2080658 RepID=A0A2V1GV27_9GAMM|nr:iron chelate uptake ABC transporter family permease subunit [Pelagibaculum spongiae]PVZ70255.1 hypothetical protein DC094_06550 [Pelagibaculum spongiae]
MIETMSEWLEILWVPGLAAIMISLMSAPLGSFLIWRKMAFFGDTLAHGSLLGVALAVFFEFAPLYGVVVVLLLLALILGLMLGDGSNVVSSLNLQRLNPFKKSATFTANQPVIGNDALLGIISHGSLALGIVVASLVADRGVNLSNYLLGDVLSVAEQDLWWIASGLLLVIAGISFSWRDLLMITVDETLAKIEGVSVARLRIQLVLLLAIAVALAIKVVGVLVLTGLMLIPAATSGRIAKSPEAMVIGAAVFGSISVVSGLLASVWLDLPSGPTIVVCALIGFLLLPKLRF